MPMPVRARAVRRCRAQSGTAALHGWALRTYEFVFGPSANQRIYRACGMADVSGQVGRQWHVHRVGERRLPSQSPLFLMPAERRCTRVQTVVIGQVGRRDLSVRCGLARHSCTVVGSRLCSIGKPQVAWRLRAAERVKAAYWAVTEPWGSGRPRQGPPELGVCVTEGELCICRRCAGICGHRLGYDGMLRGDVRSSAEVLGGS